MTQGGNIGALAVAIGILMMISVPGLIWIWRRMFRDEEISEDSS